MRARYGLADAAVEVRWDASPVRPAVRDVFRHLGLHEARPQAGAPALVMAISAAGPVPGVPPEAEEALAFDDAELTAYRAGEQIFLQTRQAVARLRPAGGSGRVALPPSVLDDPQALRGLLFGMLSISLFVLLRPRQFYPLHAAALVRDGAGMLLVANRDGGKSTLAYSLARQGWSFLSDDSVLLHPTGAVVEAVAFRQRFTMDAEARDAFPEIATAWEPLFGSEAKGAVSMHDLYPGQTTERCVPDVLILPEIADRPGSRLVPVSKAEAMHRVLGQSALVTLHPDLAPQHVEAARRLVGQTRHYRLIAGRDLKNDPPRVARLLGEVLHRAPSLPVKT